MGVGAEVEEEDTMTLLDLQRLKRLKWKPQIKKQDLHQAEEEEVGELAAGDRDSARAWLLEDDSLVGN